MDRVEENEKRKYRREQEMAGHLSPLSSLDETSVIFCPWGGGGWRDGSGIRAWFGLR